MFWSKKKRLKIFDQERRWPRESENPSCCLGKLCTGALETVYWDLRFILQLIQRDWSGTWCFSTQKVKYTNEVLTPEYYLLKWIKVFWKVRLTAFQLYRFKAPTHVSRVTHFFLSSVALVYKCKACRHPLATCQNTLPHQVSLSCKSSSSYHYCYQSGSESSMVTMPCHGTSSS